MCRRDLYLDIKGKNSPTVLQSANFQERCIALRKKIQHFCELQDTYMPGLRNVLQYPEVLNDSADVLAEHVRLYLPSELSSSDRDDVEARVCHADTSKVLDELC